MAAVITVISTAVWIVGNSRPEPAQAIPMFALRTGASCELCHTVFPGMTNYGMMVMMSDFAMLPHDAAHATGVTSFVFAEEYSSSPDPSVPKLHTENLGLLSGGFIGRDFTYYLEQHVIDGGVIGGTDQAWLAYDNLFGRTGSLQFGKFHTPFPFMPAHRITLSPYATTSNTIGENGFNEDDSHWGVTLSQMRGTLMYSASVLGGNDLVGPGAFQLSGNHGHSVDVNLMSMSDQPLNFGLGLIRGFAPLNEGGFDVFNREALYVQYIPPGDTQLQIQAVGQLGYDANPFGTGDSFRSHGAFVEAQYRLLHRNFAVLRWDTQNGNTPVAGVTLDFIHQLTMNSKLTLEARKLTTGTTLGAGFEWAGPWSHSKMLATPRLGEMPGMNMSGMSGTNMGGAAGMSDLARSLAHGDAARGSAAYQLHSCMQCHGASGAGGGIGPRLIGIAATQTPEQMYDFVKHPRAPMPDFKLSDAEIADLVAYVDSLTSGHSVMADIMKEYPGAMSGMNMNGSGMVAMAMGMAPPVYPPEQAPFENGPHGYFPGIEIGDSVSGASLFTVNCARCHGVGAAGGYGPRLVGLADHYSPSFFAWRIKDPISPMPKLELTNKQIADLAAYLETLDTQQATVGAPLQSP